MRYAALPPSRATAARTTAPPTRLTLQPGSAASLSVSPEDAPIDRARHRAAELAQVGGRERLEHLHLAEHADEVGDGGGRLRRNRAALEIDDDDIALIQEAQAASEPSAKRARTEAPPAAPGAAGPRIIEFREATERTCARSRSSSALDGSRGSRTATRASLGVLRGGKTSAPCTGCSG